MGLCDRRDIDRRMGRSVLHRRHTLELPLVHATPLGRRADVLHAPQGDRRLGAHLRRPRTRSHLERNRPRHPADKHAGDLFRRPVSGRIHRIADDRSGHDHQQPDHRLQARRGRRHRRNRAGVGLARRHRKLARRTVSGSLRPDDDYSGAYPQLPVQTLPQRRETSGRTAARQGDERRRSRGRRQYGGRRRSDRKRHCGGRRGNGQHCGRWRGNGQRSDGQRSDGQAAGRRRKHRTRRPHDRQHPQPHGPQRRAAAWSATPGGRS